MGSPYFFSKKRKISLIELTVITMFKQTLIALSLFLTTGFGLLGQVSTPLQSVKTQRKVVAFTFDDGPNAKTTSQLLELFNEVDGKATFFNVGKNLSSNKAILTELLSKGHEIGNHTMTHKRLSTLKDSDRVWKEINDFQELYQNELNFQPTLFRAPFLKYGSVTNKVLSDLDLLSVNASVYAKDAKKDIKPQDIIERIKRGIHPGAIILCHERQHTVEALKTLLPQLKKQGYEFVTVSNLLQGENEENMMAANHPFIRINGSMYSHMEANARVFPRHSRELLAMAKTKSKFSPKKAQTNTGVTIAFRTASPVVKAKFSVLEGDNRGPVFGIFQDKKFVKAAKFGRKDGPELKFEMETTKPGEEVLYEITLPNWSNVAFQGLELESANALSEIKSENKPVYVAYGNSITHGTGQIATYQTYPFIVSREMNWDLYNLAVGGGKTSVPMAQMIRDNFEHIDYMTILIGYNDYNGEGISAQEYGKRLNKFLVTIREKHQNTKIFCITPTYTKTAISKKSGASITEFRNAMDQVVGQFQNKGDEQIFLIRGEEISKEKDLKDAVHFNVKGAKSFGDLLSIELKNKINYIKK